MARDSDLCVVCVLEKEAVPSITPRCWVRAELGEASASVTSAAMPMIINLTYRATIVCLPSESGVADERGRERANAPWRNMIC